MARTNQAWLQNLALTILFVLTFEFLQGGASLLALKLWPDGTSFAAHLREAFSVWLPDGLAAGTGLWLMLATVKRFPRWGWAALSVAAAVAIFSAVLIPPVTLSPAARHDLQTSGPAAATFLDLARKSGLAANTLYVFESADPLAIDAEGLGPITHLAVSRAALAAPKPETYAALGHLLGHYRHGDLWSLALLWSIFATAFHFAASMVCRSSVDGGLHRLPVIGLIALGLILVSTPVFNVFDQAINYHADDYAMGLTHDPDALCRWLIATEATSKADPSPLEALLFYDHPPLKARLENVMRWKVAHGGL